MPRVTYGGCPDEALHDALTVVFRGQVAEVNGPQLGHELGTEFRSVDSEQLRSYP